MVNPEIVGCETNCTLDLCCNLLCSGASFRRVCSNRVFYNSECAVTCRGMAVQVTCDLLTPTC